MIQYKENPFYLTEEQSAVGRESTYDSMSLEEKSDSFCPIVFTKDEKELKELVETKAYRRNAFIVKDRERN